MAKTLSLDLRRRVVEAINGGMSHRAAGERFNVTASAAGKWWRGWRETGSVAPRRKGGDLRSHRVEAFAEQILAMIDADKDMTLVEIAERLEREHGEHFAPSTIHCFFRRRAITFKKNGARGRARSA